MGGYSILSGPQQTDAGGQGSCRDTVFARGGVRLGRSLTLQKPEPCPASILGWPGNRWNGPGYCYIVFRQLGGIWTPRCALLWRGVVNPAFVLSRALAPGVP